MPSKRAGSTLLGMAFILAATLLPAARIVTPPEKVNGLSARWQWALDHGRSHATIIVYASRLGDSDQRRHCGGEKPGKRLGSLLGLAAEESGKKRTFFLFHNPAPESSRPGAFTKLDLAHADSRITPLKAPIYFLGTFPQAESVSLLTGLFKSVSEPDLARKLLLAVAVHPLHDMVVPFLIATAQQDKRESVRRKAVFWLGLHPTDRAVRFLEKLLESGGNDDAKKQAVASLGLNRHARATAVLLDRAEGRGPEDIREKALFWLSTKVRQALKTGAGSWKNRKKSDALTALAQMPTESAGAKLAALARSNGDANLRGEAVFWLVQRNDPRALPIMREILANATQPDRGE